MTIVHPFRPQGFVALEDCEGKTIASVERGAGTVLTTIDHGGKGLEIAEAIEEADAKLTQAGKAAGELLWNNRLYEPLTKIAKEEK